MKFMSSTCNEIVFLLEHRELYNTDKDPFQHTNEGVYKMVEDRLRERYKGYCSPSVIVAEFRREYETTIKVGATVLLIFDDKEHVNKFKLKFLREIDNILEIPHFD